MKQPPWITHNKIWKTQSSFMSFLRGGIRRSLWNKSPIKLEFIKNHRKKIPNPNPRGRVAEVWGATCYICGQDYPLNLVDVDHLEGNHSLKTMDDLQSFIEAIVCVTEEELGFACKSCHKIKSHCEKQGISFELARAEKEAIQLIKEKKDVQWLKEHNILPGKNAAARRQQIVDKLMEEKEDGTTA